MPASSSAQTSPAPHWPPTWRAVVLAAALGLVAGAINLNAPTVFFDSQIMLGGSLAVLAVLCLGWWGLLTGALALGATALRWGHPYELIIGMLQYTWLLIFLHRLNGDWSNRDNGRVVLAAVGFWVLAGIPLELFLFNRAFDLPVSQALGIGLKESVTGILNATLGLLAFLILRWWKFQRQPGTFSVRGLAFTAILAAVSIPGLGLTLILSHQLKTAVLEQEFLDLRHFGDRAADLAEAGRPGALEAFAREAGDKEFLLRRTDGSTLSSDPALFERLQQNYEIETPSRTGRDNLGIYRPRKASPVIATDADSYWFATFDRPSPDGAGAASRITVVETPPEMVRLLDYQLLLPSFAALLALLLVGAAAAEWAGRGVDRQFQRILPQAGDRPPSTTIRELNSLVETVNDRTQRMKLAAAATGVGFWVRDLTTHLEEWDDQMLQIYGVRREEFDGRWEPFVHPDDLREAQNRSGRAMEPNTTGRYEYRILRPDGTLRHVRGMSGTIRNARGEVVHEFGVNFDVTEEKEAAAREKQLEAAHRRDLENKLKTSLNAAAVAHEINQPLSRLLLRASLDLEKEHGADKDTLRALVDDAERVVETIEKMRVLLRNVETVRQPVNLAQIVRSALFQLKQPLRKAGVKVSHTGPDEGCRVSGDDVQLQTILTNLLNNAIEAIVDAGGPRREISIEQRPGEDFVELVLGDSGPGWPGGSLDEMLLRTTKRKGSGIGLYVVKTALENHRGEMEIGRSPLGGAEFRLKFPRSSAVAEN